ncbi:MAG: sigma 54-interacting transcriptional regulator [Bacillota bacterium]|nr:sigma 54-interacting transcriptional regulator [Bacillota bacterium]
MVEELTQAQIILMLLEGISLDVPIIEMVNHPSYKSIFKKNNYIINKLGEEYSERLSITKALFDVIESKKIEQAEGIKNFHHGPLQRMKMENTKHFVTNSKKMKELLGMVLNISKVDSTVYVHGESGVGKELIVDMIHANSARRTGPLVKINCAAIPENLLESELFGYESGAFSGASTKGKVGLFELANEGILFLDEIGDMPLNLQAKLLGTLQDRLITRIGGIKTKKVDVRIITATNRDLRKLIEKGLFREDLYYRLNVIPIFIPPLRNRKEDIQALLRYFVEVFEQKYDLNYQPKKFTSEAMECLINYSWPGNVRELENLIERLIVTIQEEYINITDLPERIQQSKNNTKNAQNTLSLRRAVEETERKILEDAFATYHSTYEIARVLDINQSTVVRKAARYGISYG